MFPGKVPVIGTVGVVFTLLIAVGLPVLLAVLCRKKLKAGWLPLLIGAVTFPVFALLLESLLHSVMLGAFGERLTGNPALYALYGGLAAGLFEETGRWVAMRFVMKKRLTAPNALMYGVGHGGIEAMILILPTYIANLSAILAINSGAMDAALTAMDEATRSATVTQLMSFWTTESYMFFMAGCERISAVILHISLSYLVYRCVKERKLAWYLLAVGLHFAVDAGTIVLASLASIPVLEITVFVCCIVLAVFVFRMVKKELSAPPAPVGEA